MSTDKRKFSPDGLRCSYLCPHYQDGPVMSICNKYNPPMLRYEAGGGPPVRHQKCISDQPPAGREVVDG